METRNLSDQDYPGMFEFFDEYETNQNELPISILNPLDEPDVNGLTPLELAVKSNHFAHAKFLIRTGKVNINILYCINLNKEIEEFISSKILSGTNHFAIFDFNTFAFREIIEEDDQDELAALNEPDENGKTPLHNAVSSGHLNHVRFLLETGKVDINQKINGNSALSIAINQKNLKMIELLIIQPDIDLSIIYEKNSDSLYELYQLSENIDNNEIIKVLIKKTSILSYADNLLQVQTAKLWKQFFNEPKKSIFNNKLSETEKNQIKGRLTWSKVISNVDQYSNNLISYNLYILIQRLIKLGYTYYADPDFIQKCLNYLQINSRIIMTFDAAKSFKHGLTAIRPLNVFENNVREKDEEYFNKRIITENSLFNFLNEELKNEFLYGDPTNRPKYAALIVGDITPINNYGKSFLILNDAVKMNSLYLCRDSLDSKINLKTTLTPATYYHLETLLAQSNDKFLKAIVEATITGKFPKSFNQQYSNSDEGYIEVMIPSINLLDRNIVEHIHIDLNEYKLDISGSKMLKKMGLKVTNLDYNPYAELYDNLKTRIKKNDVDYINKILSQYPSLIIMHGYDERDLLVHAISSEPHPQQEYIGKLFLNHNYNPDRKTDGKTPLHRSIELINKKYPLKFFIEELHADINAKIDTPMNLYINGMTPIMYCLTMNDKEDRRKIFKYLTNEGADLNHVCQSGESAMTLAAKCNDTESLKALLANCRIQLDILENKSAHMMLYKQITVVFDRCKLNNNEKVIEFIRELFNPEWKHIEILVKKDKRQHDENNETQDQNTWGEKKIKSSLQFFENNNNTQNYSSSDDNLPKFQKL